MKTVKRSKVYLLVVALVLVLSMTVGLTMAYFSDSTEAEGGIPVTLGGLGLSGFLSVFNPEVLVIISTHLEQYSSLICLITAVVFHLIL